MTTQAPAPADHYLPDTAYTAMLDAPPYTMALAVEKNADAEVVRR